MFRPFAPLIVITLLSEGCACVGRADHQPAANGAPRAGEAEFDAEQLIARFEHYMRVGDVKKLNTMLVDGSKFELGHPDAPYIRWKPTTESFGAQYSRRSTKRYFVPEPGSQAGARQRSFIGPWPPWGGRGPSEIVRIIASSEGVRISEVGTWYAIRVSREALDALNARSSLPSEHGASE